MSHAIRSIAIAGLAGLLAATTPARAAQAGWRPITIPASASAAAPIPVNLYYPTQAAERSIAMGPYLAHLAPQDSLEGVGENAQGDGLSVNVTAMKESGQ